MDPLKAFTPISGTFIAPLMVVLTTFAGGGPAAADRPAQGQSRQVLVCDLRGRHGAPPGLRDAQGADRRLHRAHPYRGAAQILPDVISGQVPIGVVSAAAGLAQARAAIGLMNMGKLAGAENVAAIADALPGFNVAPRLMLLAPAGTPAAIVERLNEAVRGAASADLAQAAAQQGAIPAYLPPSQLAATLAQESAEWAGLMKTQKIASECARPRGPPPLRAARGRCRAAT